MSFKLPLRLQKFILESNEIEGIYQEITLDQTREVYAFLALEKITVDDMCRIVKAFQPNAKLRDQHGMNVRIGNHIPPRGGPAIRNKLEEILKCDYEHPYVTHCKYETLHPFMDCNGRSGRLLWLWQMEKQGRWVARMGFLQTFYYQSLEFSKV